MKKRSRNQWKEIRRLKTTMQVSMNALKNNTFKKCFNLAIFFSLLVFMLPAARMKVMESRESRLNRLRSFW